MTAAATTAPPTQAASAAANSVQQLRAKLLTPRVLKTEPVNVEHPDGEIIVYATELPYSLYRQFQAAAKDRPAEADELMVVHSIVTADNQLVFHPEDTLALGDLPASLVVPLVEACNRVNGR